MVARNAQKSATKKPASKQLKGVMQPGETLTLKAFMERMSVSYTGVRSMIRRGLKVRMDGRYRRVRADDWNEYLANLPVKPGDDEN